jgi:hypothetical protein
MVSLWRLAKVDRSACRVYESLLEFADRPEQVDTIAINRHLAFQEKHRPPNWAQSLRL